MPTDDRFKQLTEHQIDMMFIYYLMKPDDSDLKELYRRNQETKVVREELPTEVLKAKGFTDAQIAKIKEDLGALK